MSQHLATRKGGPVRSALTKFATSLLRVLRGLWHFFDLHRAEGWRYVGLAVLFSAFSEALDMGDVETWAGFIGIVIALEAQKAIEGRKR